MTELKDTVNHMISSDYKERLKAELAQATIRRDGLDYMLNKWDRGDLTFVPTAPRSLYELQLRAMNNYVAALEARAKIEGFDYKN